MAHGGNNLSSLPKLKQWNQRYNRALVIRTHLRNQLRVDEVMRKVDDGSMATNVENCVVLGSVDLRELLGRS